MRYLAEGQSSIVFSISREELLRLAGVDESFCGNDPCFAMRIGKTVHIPTVNSTCETVLQNYIGSEREIPLTDALRAAVLDVEMPNQETRDVVKASGHASVLPDFTVNPLRVLRQLPEFDFTPLEKWSEDSLWALEVKPKAAWRSPLIVGIAVDGVEHYMHPKKLRVCRFSQMQHYKKATELSTYCPNNLFSGCETAVLASLQSLVSNPQNNFRILSGSCAFPLSTRHLAAVAASLQASRMMQAIAQVQLFGCVQVDDSTPYVLDVELLHVWGSASGDVQWIVAEETPNSPAEKDAYTNPCQCQQDISGKTSNALNSESKPTYRHVNPTISYATAEERFYNSTTAKDVSLLITLAQPSTKEDDGSEHGCASLTATPALPNSGAYESIMLVRDGKAGNHTDDEPAFVCRVNVVDIDTKNHKTLEHYYTYDQKIVKSSE